ncbi:MAG: hypothetical protein RML45_03015 [Acetobacteraceae bacterium]|nr:hypothetical protein [Acetobacteraceae bacterium]
MSISPPLWSAVRAETLILRGEHSDVLPAEVAATHGRGAAREARHHPGLRPCPRLVGSEREISLVARVSRPMDMHA